MIDFCVLGSGVSGSTIANILSKKYSVHVFDKARGPGGRSSNKRFKKKKSNFPHHQHQYSWLDPINSAPKWRLSFEYSRNMKVTKYLAGKLDCTIQM